MSYYTTSTDVGAAIKRSITHDEIVTIEVASETDAKSVIRQLLTSSESEEVDSVRVSRTLTEVWGYGDEAGDGQMDWRVHVQIRASDDYD